MLHYTKLLRNGLITNVRTLMKFVAFIIYSICILIFYDYFFVQPDFSSKLMSSSYACHDTPSCAAKMGLSINQTIPKNKDLTKHAFFSALYTDNYLLGALILGYTIRKYHPHHPMYMLYFDNKLQNETTHCALKAVGWQLMSVKRIPPLIPGTLRQFVDQFTKLILWNLTQFDSIVYLDSDTVVLGDLSHLHELVSEPWRTGFEFAAATDNFFGTYIYKFNAGVLVLHPSNLVFNELMRTYGISGNYHPTMAEQEFLNQFYRLRYLELPTIYNMNMALYSSKLHLWDTLRPDFKIVHFTIQKPFKSNERHAWGYKGVYQLYKEVYQDFFEHANISFIRTSCHTIVSEIEQ